MLARVVKVGAEVAYAHELELVPGLGRGKGGFNEAVLYGDGIGVHQLHKVALHVVVRIVQHHGLIQAELRGGRGFGVYPMQRALHLALAFAAAGFGIVCAVNGCNVAVFVGFVAGAFYYVCALEPHFAIGLQAEILLGRVIGKVVPLNVKLLTKRHLARACGFAAGQVFKLYIFFLILRPVFYNKLYRVKHGAHTVRFGVKILPQAVFKHCAVHYAVRFCNAYPIEEVLYGLWRIAAAAQRAKGGHARIVPAGNVMLLHKAPEIALAHYGIGKIQPRELYLPGLMFKFALFNYPVVKRPVRFVFKGAEGMGYALDGVLNGMRKVIHGIDAPFCAGVMMRHMLYAVYGRIAHVYIGAGHVYLGAEGARAVLKFAVAHAVEQIKVLLNAPVAIGRVFAGFGQRAAVFAHFVL